VSLANSPLWFRRIAEQSLLAAGGSRLYVGQSGSALINKRRQVLGINSPALGRQAIITIPAPRGMQPSLDE